MKLVKVTQKEIGNEKVNAVDARELYKFLEVGTNFKDWTARRIDEYDFIEEIDFRSFLSKSSGGRPSKEYAIALDMAKELAMVERNDKGRQARRYFIECEKELTALKATETNRLQYRREARLEYRPMTDAVRSTHINPKWFHYSNEADLINRIALGMTASQFREYHGIKMSDSLRDYLTSLQIECVTELQRTNTVLINLGWDYKDREKTLDKLFTDKYSRKLTNEIHRITA